MNFKLIYISPGGTTKSTTLILDDIIKKNNHQVEVINIGVKPYRDNLRLTLEKLGDTDIVGFGSPVYHMNMLEPMLKLFDEMVTSCNNYGFTFRSFFYLNYGGITSGKAFEIAAQNFQKIGIPVIGAMKIIAPHFHHNETFPTENTYRFIEEFYYKMQEKEFAPIEWQRIKEIFRPEKLRVNIIYPLAHLIGEKRNLPITINWDKCVRCGKCAAECPVNAISINTNLFIDFNKCIHCYHCVASCKQKAVVSPVEKIDGMIHINKKILGIEKSSDKIYI